MSSENLLSIIVPVYNSQKYISKCIESLIKQKDKFEIILINDGSTDSSLDICNHYAKIDKRIKVINKQNGGVSNARNNGLSIAKGSYIMFVDSDDILDDDWTKVLKYICDDDVYYFTKSIKKCSSRIDMLKYIIGYNDIGLCFAGPFSKIFKKSFLLENKINFDENLINGEDMLFNINALLKSRSFSIINESYYNYRNFQGSATKSFNKKIISSDKYFQCELNNCLAINKVNTELANELCLYCTQMAIIVILNKVSYIKNYKYAKYYLDFLKESPYKDVINRKILVNKKFNTIYKLIGKKFNYIVYRVLRSRNKLNILLGKEYYFTKI